MRAGSCKDLVWAEEFISEFLRRPSCTKELSLDECLAANSEVGCGYSSGVSRTLVSLLGIGYVLLELLVKLVEVGDKVSGAS